MSRRDQAIMLRIGEEDRAALDRVAAAWGVSKADVIRLLVRDQDRRLHNGGRPPVLEAMTRKVE